MKLTRKEKLARKRVCLALDFPIIHEALTLSSELSDLVGMFKIGKQLHTIACNKGVSIVSRIYATDYNERGNVFLDLKYHDTPNTVYEASKAAAVDRVYMFNIHIAGGEKMCKKAFEGSFEGAIEREIDRPKVIGVTELTSLNDDDLEVQGLGIKYNDLVRRRTELAIKWGLDGIVCPANKAGELEKEFGSDLLYVTPGIEWAGKRGEGQKQLYTPGMAVRECNNSILVVGSAITKADDRRKAAYEILQDMAEHL